MRYVDIWVISYGWRCRTLPIGWITPKLRHLLHRRPPERLTARAKRRSRWNGTRTDDQKVWLEVMNQLVWRSITREGHLASWWAAWWRRCWTGLGRHRLKVIDWWGGQGMARHQLRPASTRGRRNVTKQLCVTQMHNARNDVIMTHGGKLVKKRQRIFCLNFLALWFGIRWSTFKSIMRIMLQAKISKGNLISVSLGWSGFRHPAVAVWNSLPDILVALLTLIFLNVASNSFCLTLHLPPRVGQAVSANSFHAT